MGGVPQPLQLCRGQALCFLGVRAYYLVATRELVFTAKTRGVSLWHIGRLGIDPGVFSMSILLSNIPSFVKQILWLSYLRLTCLQYKKCQLTNFGPSSNKLCNAGRCGSIAEHHLCTFAVVRILFAKAVGAHPPAHLCNLHVVDYLHAPIAVT